MGEVSCDSILLFSVSGDRGKMLLALTHSVFRSLKINLLIHDCFNFKCF